jgi:hypothetical protein
MRQLPGGRQVTREERLRAALDGTGMEDQAASLATLPAAQVDLIVSALKASGRAALACDRARRRQRVADRRKYGHIEDGQQADATNRQVLALARRAGSILDTLSRLKEHYDDGPAVLALAVAGLRAQGYSDGQIGQALGVTRYAVGLRFGRRGDLYTGLAGTGDPA